MTDLYILGKVGWLIWRSGLLSPLICALTLSHVGWANDDTEISLLSFFQLKLRSTVGEAIITEKHKIALVKPNWETVFVVES